MPHIVPRVVLNTGPRHDLKLSKDIHPNVFGEGRW